LRIVRCKKKSLQKNKKNNDLRHLAFARGPPPYYYQGLLMLNVNDLMGIGAFIRV
jgi:hypothetical protein